MTASTRYRMGAGEIDVKKLAERSAFHAQAVAVAVQMQQQLERQRRIWTLRAEFDKYRVLLAGAEAALQIEEEEQARDAELAKLSIERFETV